MAAAEHYASQSRHMRPRQAQQQRMAPSRNEPAAARGDEEVEVMEMFEVLRRDIGEVKADLGKRIDSVDTHIVEVKTDLGKRIDDVNADLIARIEKTDVRIDKVNTDVIARVDKINVRIDDVKTEIVTHINDVRHEVVQMFNSKIVARGVAVATVAAIAVSGTFAVQLFTLLR